MERINYNDVAEESIKFDLISVGYHSGVKDMVRRKFNHQMKSEVKCRKKSIGESSIRSPNLTSNNDCDVNGSTLMMFGNSMVSPNDLLIPMSYNVASMNDQISASVGTLCGVYERNVLIPRTNTKTAKLDKANKGLRHFSMQVLKKVQEKQNTTYNEVAEELVKEFGNNSNSADKKTYEHKNIRRRVYDALNVLMAMNIIHKEKREIHWVGLPPTASSHDLENLKKLNNDKRIKINERLAGIRDLISLGTSVKSIMEKNSERNINKNHTIDLPFSLITTETNATVDLSLTSARDDYFLTCSHECLLYDETNVLTTLGEKQGVKLGRCNMTEIDEIKSWIPKSIQPLAEALSIYSPDEFNIFMTSFIKYIGSLSASDLNQDSMKILFDNQLKEAFNNKNNEVMSSQIKSNYTNGYMP